ncbi:TSPO protein, partial [Corythaeola cristata]|nr:TSPO protein [Corythaeola cristata]
QGRMWTYTVGFTVLPHVGGFLGWFLNRKETPVWYEKLKKPAWCPPRKIFPVAWTVLYTGMGAKVLGFRNVLGNFSVLNLTHSYSVSLPLAGWFIVVPGKMLRVPENEGHSRCPLSALQALIDILCLDALAIGTTCSWYRINKIAALLLVPYLGWMAMATCLTIRIWKDNPEQKPGKGE